MTFSAAGKRFVLFGAIEAAVLCCVCALLFCWNALSGEKGFHTLGEIREEGVIHVGVLMNPMEYYLHQGKVGGFAYELVKVIADSMKVKPSFHVYYTYEDINMALLRNDVDLLAAAETPTPEWRAFFSFTHPLFVSDVVSLSRRGSSDSAVDFGTLPSPVFGGLSARDFREHPQWRMHIYRTSEDQLLEVMDRDGKPDAALAMGVYWRAYSALFPNLAVKDTLPGKLPLCWAVRRGNDSLLLTVERILKNYGKERDFARLRRKYTDPNSSERNRMAENSRRIPFGSISRYDDLLKKYSAEHGVDWRLMAALIYQESKFHLDVVGKGNTIGLMQFAPATASRFGVHAASLPAKQIEGGCRYVEVLKRKIMREGVTDSMQIVPMIVAAYNAGGGHLTDAIAVAREVDGLDPTRWEGGVKEALLLLADWKHYRMPVVKNGSYHGGRHTLRYVKSVMERTAHYQAVVDRDSLVEIR